MRTSALFSAKKHGFLEIYGVPMRDFADKEGGAQLFAILCERLLWTAPPTLFHQKS